MTGFLKHSTGALNYPISPSLEQLDDVSEPCRYLGENCSQNGESQKVKGLRQE